MAENETIVQPSQESKPNEIKQYNEEKKFLKEEAKKNTEMMKLKLQKQFFLGVIAILVVAVISQMFLVFFVLDKIKTYDREMATTKQYAYNLAQGILRTTQKEIYIADICKVALHYNSSMDEDRLYNLAQEIYNTGYSKYNLSIDECIILAATESEFHRKALSKKGAKGIFQVMNYTGAEACEKLGIMWNGDLTLYDEVLNTKIGLYVYHKYKGVFDNSLLYGLVAYNSGPEPIMAIYASKQKLTGQYLDYYKLWKQRKKEIETLLRRKLNVEDI